MKEYFHFLLANDSSKAGAYDSWNLSSRVQVYRQSNSDSEKNHEAYIEGENSIELWT